VAEWLGQVCPALVGRARELAGRLAALLRDLATVDRPLHGDFYAKQVLQGPDVGVLDFDEAGRGDPALDLGLFIAHLERDVVRGTIPPDRVEPVRASLLEGYRSAAELPDPARVGLYTAVGLLRLAPHPFRSREPQWPERTGAMLERAEAVLRAVAPRKVGAAVRPVPQGR